jgi:phospholipid/cholesterol/gamma-HCH transport system substrate-binding protein
MQKQAPSIGRIMVAVGFALSCFALLLFLWVTFGGPVPFKPQSYRFTADFPEAITLQKEADVRVGGVSVGKVKSLELPPEGNATRAVIEIEPQYAPISSDAEAILRQKTLLGETYVELTTGTQDPGSADGETAQSSAIDVGEISGDDAPHAIPEGGHLESTQVADQTQIDEIFQGFDEETRQAFQLWMKNTGIAVDGRGLDLNDAFGNIGPFAQDASDVLATLRSQEQALRVIVRETGAVFEALTARDQELAGAIVGTNRTFRALASRDEALAETFQILPTFETESRLTLERLDRFSENATPLFRDLRPVARNLSPTLRDLRRLAPNARRLFINLNPLVDAAIRGLPALRDILDEARPALKNLDPFLANLNPIVRYLDYLWPTAADFMANIPAATSGYLPGPADQPVVRNISRQMGIINAESLSVWPTRLATNRGNGYLQPFAIGNPNSAHQGEIFPNHDCLNTNATGGLGNEQVTRDPASTPAPAFGVFPLSVGPALTPEMYGDNFPGGTAASPGPIAFAPCTLQSQSVGSFPAAFGGGDVPSILPDP